MKRLLCVLTCSLAIFACSAYQPGRGPSPKPKPPTANCAGLVAQAMTSPTQVVPGSYDCLTPSAQADQQSCCKVTDDESFKAYAAVEPVYTVAAPVGVIAGYNAYTISNPETNGVRCMGLKLAEDGRVDVIGFMAEGMPCPES